VFVGDLMSFWTETLRIGNTSITTKVVVEAIRGIGQRVLVTEAQVVYVNVGEDRKPRPIRPGGKNALRE
jgi:acyl-CoA thioesterase YciA